MAGNLPAMHGPVTGQHLNKTGFIMPVGTPADCFALIFYINGITR